MPAISWRSPTAPRTTSGCRTSTCGPKGTPAAASRGTRTQSPSTCPNTAALVAEGKFRVPVADLMVRDANRLLISLAAVDTKGQESRSQVVTIHIATDSFDRQLRKLMITYAGRRDNIEGWSLAYHKQQLAELKELASAIPVLADSLEPGQPPGEKQASWEKRIQGHVASLGYRATYGSNWFFDFQNANLLTRLQRYGQYAACWSRLAVDGDAIRTAVKCALGSANPKAELPKVLPLLEAAIAREEKASARVEADFALIETELAGYLTANLRRAIVEAGPVQWQDAALLVNLRTAAQEILAIGARRLPDGLPEDVNGALGQVAAGDQTSKACAAAVPLLDRFGEVLAHACTRKRSSARSDRKTAHNRARGRDRILPPGAVGAVAEGLYLAGENFDTDEIALLQAGFSFLHLYSRQSGPLRPLGDPEPSGRARQEAEFRLFHVLQRARTHAEDLRLAMACRRLEPGQPDFEALWLALREQYLELLSLRQQAASQASWHGQLETLIESMPELDCWGLPQTSPRPPCPNACTPGSRRVLAWP